MITLTRSIPLFVLFCLICNWAFSQGLTSPYQQAFERVKAETRIDSLNNFQRSELARSIKRKAIAEEQARLSGWIIRQVQPDGQVIELIDLDEDGKPVYVSTSNLTAAKSISTDRVWPSGPMGLNLTGLGLTAGEWDAGRVRLSHVEFQGRAIQGDANATNDSHATHVAGTIMAAGINPSAIGGAYQANLRAFDWNNDSAEMAAEAANGLLISNHSYGTITGWAFQSGSWHWYGSLSIDPMTDWKFGFYNTTCQNWDYIARQAPYYLIMKAAGNDRSDNHSGLHKVWDNGWVDSSDPRNPDGQYDCLPTYSNAKNIMTVGAVNDLATGWVNASGVSMSSFSGWGPTDDGRIKPDIVANGVGVFSTDRNNDTHYSSKSGTSMATPSATGSALLLQQHYHDLNGAFMRASTLKGLIIHTADEAGRPGPDYSFGWGLMNTAKAADHITDNRVHTHILEESLAQGQTFEMQVYSDGTAPLLATVCWTDVPGLPHAAALNNRSPKLVNDLDLRIIAGPATWQPFVLDPSNPTANAATGDNVVDNVEQVRIASPTPGYYTIRITHKGNLAEGPQPFSLLISRVSCFAAIQPAYDQHSCQSAPLTLRGNAAPTHIYQWLLDGNPISGATTPDWIPHVSGKYSLQIDNGNCLARSLEREIIIDPASFGGTLNTSASTVCYGNNHVTLNLTGHVGSVVRWETSNDSWNTISTLSHSLTNLQLTNLIANHQVRAVVQSGVCPAEYSTHLDIAVIGNGGVVSASTTACYGHHSGTLNLSSHTGTIIGWEFSNDNWFTAVSIANVTDQQAYSNLTQDTRFRAVLTEAPCPILYSTDAVISIVPLLDVQASLLPNGPICMTDGGVSLQASYIETAPYDRCTEYSLAGVPYSAFPHAGTNVFSSAVDDAVSSAIPIGFSFPFFCSEHTEVYVSSNGFISFTPTSDDGCCSGESLPQLDVHQNLIAGCWTDNRLMNANDVKYQTTGTAPNRKFILSFGGTYQYYGAQNLAFQLVLHERTGDIEIIHINIPNNTSFQRTVGIENQTQTIGLTPAGMNASSNFSSVGQTFRFRPSNSPALISWNWSNSASAFSSSTQNTTDPAPPLGVSVYKLEVLHAYTGCATRLSLPFQVDELTIGGSLGPDLTVCKGLHLNELNLSGSNGSVIRWESSTDDWLTVQTLNHTLPNLEVENLTQPTAYRAVSANGACPEQASQSIRLSLDDQPIGGSATGAVTVCAGNNSGVLLLSGHWGTILNWESSTDSWTTSNPIAETTDLLLFQDLTQETEFRAVLGNGICPNVYSVPVTVRIDAPSVGGTVGPPATVCTGTNTHLLELSGENGTVTRWEWSTDNWQTSSSFATNLDSYTAQNLDQATSFRAIVKNGVCEEAASNSVPIHVDELSEPGNLSQDLTLCRGQNFAQLDLNGYTGHVLQWERSLDDWQTYEVVANSNDFQQLVNEIQPYSWRVRTQNGVCPAVASNPIHIAMDQPTVRGQLTTSINSVCSGSNNVSLQLNGHTGTVLNWNLFSTSPYLVQTIPASGASLTLSDLTQNTLVTATVKNGVCPAQTSNGISILVRPSAQAGTLSQDAMHCFGSASGSLQISQFVGSSLSWEQSIDGGQTWFPLGFSSPVYHYNQLIRTTHFRVRVSNAPCPPVYSNSVVVQVVPKPLAGTLSASQTVCMGASAEPIRLTGHIGTVVAWELSTDNWATSTLLPATSDELIPSNTGVTTWYRAVVQDGPCPSVRSNTIKIESVAPPQVGALQSSQALCKKSQANLTLNHASGQLIWEHSTDHFATTNSVHSSGLSLITPPLSRSTSYRVRARTPFCEDAVSNTVLISVVDSSRSGTIVGPSIVCSSDATANLELIGHRGLILYWMKSTDRWATYELIPSNSSTVFVPVDPTGAEFKAVIQNAPCPSASSVPHRIDYQVEPVGGRLVAVLNESNAEADCATSSSQLVLSDFRGTISHWEYSFDGGVNWLTLAHTGSMLKPSAPIHGALIRVAVSQPGCPVTYSQWAGASSGLGSTVQVQNGCGSSTIIVKGAGGIEPYGYFLQPLAGVQNPAGTFTQVPPGTYHAYVRDGRFCYHFSIVEVTGVSDPPSITQVRLNNQGKVVVNWLPLSTTQLVQYQLRYRQIDQSQWQTSGWFNANQRAFAAVAGQTYEIQVRGRCSTTQQPTAWSASSYFTVNALRETILMDAPLAGLRLYPNPTTGEFWLNWSTSPQEVVKVKVFDVRGLLLWSHESLPNGQSAHRFDLPTLAAGIYLVQVSDEWGIHSLKLIVK